MARVVVYSDGTVLWIPQALFKSTCPLEIEFFPFDTQYEQFKYETQPVRGLSPTTSRANEWYSDGQDEFPHPALQCAVVARRIRVADSLHQSNLPGRQQASSI
uniref:Neur_chan_LBD domain-containing protein n=1 Tax=Macrostomum lignano TaxID=282301 RepID=A0A1I8FBB8_9PLAT